MDEWESTDNDAKIKGILNLKKTELELGLLGKLWGSKYSGTNIAGLICILGFIILIGAFAFPSHIGEKAQERAIQIGFSLISMSLGYLFGNYQKKE